MKSTLAQLLKNNKQFILFLILFLCFRGAIADWNFVPTGSMQPTIKEGDLILVNKAEYDIKLPFTNISLYHLDNPKRGDIIVFKSHAANKRLVKRIIGIPGDTVALKNNRLFVNHKPAEYRYLNQRGDYTRYQETIHGFTHRMQIKTNNHSPRSSFQNIKVPSGYYLVLGDNRDNSADSRYYGLVPYEEIIGRSPRALLSFDMEHFYQPRKDRIFKRL